MKRLRLTCSIGKLCSLNFGAVLFAISVAPLAALAQTHVMQPSDLANLKTVGDPKLSPDGRLIAYTVHTPTASGTPRNQHIWVAATDHVGTAHPFVYGSGADSSPAWSPDGMHLAFLSDRVNPLAEPGSPYSFTLAASPEQKDKPPAVPDATSSDTDKTTQLWWIAVDGGEAQPLTNLPGGIRSFKFSPDGRRIAFLRTDPDSKAQQDRRKAKNDETVIDHDYHFSRLWVLDLATHQARQLTAGDQNIDTLDWSPDGASIVSRVSPTPRLDDFWRVSKVVIFDADNGAVKQVVEQTSGYEEPTFSQDGLRLAYSRFTTKRITDIHFVRTLATGQDLLLEGKLKGTLAEFHWMPGGHLLVNAYVGAHTETNDLDVSTGNAVPLANLPPTALDFDPTRDGSAIAFLGETPTQPLEVSVWRKGSAQVLTATNPQVSGWSLGTQREVQWQNPKDHHTIYGVLTLPPGYIAGRRYKTLIHLHGGPEEAFTVGFNANWYNYGALFASQGYVVLQPNYRGSAGQEIAFTEGDFQDAGGKEFDDMMAGVDWLEQQGIADPNRLAIGGWSYGGLMTSWAITHTDRFKVAMSGAAVNDLYSMATTTDIAPSYLASYMGPLETPEDAARYDKHSAIRYVAACHTPVLVLHGEADVRVPLSQGQEFYHALRFLNREAEMVTYPREPHIFGEREHQIDSLTRELGWFDAHLPKETAP